jgi:hypothetical protein
MKLPDKFEAALVYAKRAHGDQPGKKPGIPYIARIGTLCAREKGSNMDTGFRR